MGQDETLPVHGETTMLYRTLYSRNVFAELDRLTRDMQQALDLTPAIRGRGPGAFPALNVGTTPRSVEVYGFAPGIDPATLDVQIEKGVLTVAGERRAEAPASDGKATIHARERFDGRFRRVVNLPDDIDPEAVQARYRDGLLHISVPRREPAKPHRVNIQ